MGVHQTLVKGETSSIAYTLDSFRGRYNKFTSLYLEFFTLGETEYMGTVFCDIYYDCSVLNFVVQEQRPDS